MKLHFYAKYEANASKKIVDALVSGYMNWTLELHNVCDWVPGQKHP